MKIFVTGGAGFIGSNFIRHVLAPSKGYAIVNYDKLTYAGNLGQPRSRSRTIRTIVSSRATSAIAAAVEAAMRGCDAVVHFAAESHVDRSIYEPAPAIETNVKGTFVLAAGGARKLRIERFVHISTDEVYGDMPPGAFADEDSPHAAQQPILGVQGAFRSLVRSYVRTYGFPAVITRSSNNYGPYPVSGKISAADDHQRARQQTAADLRRRRATTRLVARRR